MNSTITYPNTIGYMEVIVPAEWAQARNREHVTNFVERYLYGGFYVQAVELTEIWEDHPVWRVIVRFATRSMDDVNDQMNRFGSGLMRAKVTATYTKNTVEE